MKLEPGTSGLDKLQASPMRVIPYFSRRIAQVDRRGCATPLDNATRDRNSLTLPMVPYHEKARVDSSIFSLLFMPGFAGTLFTVAPATDAGPYPHEPAREPIEHLTNLPFPETGHF